MRIVLENPQVESPKLVVRQAHHPELCRRIEGRPHETKEILQESRVVKQEGGKGIRRGDAETRRRGVTILHLKVNPELDLPCETLW